MTHLLTSPDIDRAVRACAAERLLPRTPRRRWAALAVGVALLALPGAARAEVQVHGTPQAARVETGGGSVGDVLEALRKNFDVRWQADAPLARPLTGAYEGSLNRILARVLDGYNFVLKPLPGGGVEVRVLGLRGARAVAGNAPAGGATPVGGATPATLKTDPPKAPLPPAAPAASQPHKVAAQDSNAPMKIAEARLPAPRPNEKGDNNDFPAPMSAQSGAAAFPDPNARSTPAMAPEVPEQGAAALPFPDPNAMKMSSIAAPQPVPGGGTEGLAFPAPGSAPAPSPAPAPSR
ncbi:MAG: hypothetical protein IT538_05230 [Variibacter sp.]|nr:hypothetical protein [Variibacter sp.]